MSQICCKIVDRWSFATCPRPHKLLLEILGEHSDDQNVVVFSRMNIRMLLCSSSECWYSWCSSSGFINDECMMSFWVCSMRDIRFVRLYPQKVTSPYASKSCWIKYDKVEPNLPWTLCRREIVDLQLQAHASRRFCKILYSTKSQTHPSLVGWGKISFLICFLSFHQLHCS